MSKMAFGEWVGSLIIGNSGSKVTKIAYGYYDNEALKNAAVYIDEAVRLAQIHEEKLNPLESMMIDVLFDLAGFKNRKEVHEGYHRYLKE